MELAECPTCEREMLAALLPLHLSCGTCTPRGSGGAAAAMARTVQDSMRAYTPFGGRCDGPAGEQGYEYQARYERQKRADHLLSAGGTVSNFGPNVQRQELRRQSLAEHVSAGGTVANYAPNVRNHKQKRQKKEEEKENVGEAAAAASEPMIEPVPLEEELVARHIVQTALPDEEFIEGLDIFGVSIIGCIKVSGSPPPSPPPLIHSPIPPSATCCCSCCD